MYFKIRRKVRSKRNESPFTTLLTEKGEVGVGKGKKRGRRKRS